MTFSTYSVREIVYDENAAAKSFEESAQFAADWNGRAQGRITTLIAPHEVSTCHEPWLSRLADLAGELNLGITIHLAESPLDVRFSKERYGKDPVEVLRDSGILNHHVIAAHSIELTESDMDILAGFPCHPIACPQGHLKLAGKTTPIPALLARGVNVALGTDSAVTNNNLDLFEEMRLAVLIQAHLTGNAAALPGATALKLLTVNGAKALNRNDLGTLEVGKRADIVLLDTSAAHMHPMNSIYSNIIYSAAAADVWGVVVDGRILMEDRHIVSFDEADVIHQVEMRMAHLHALADA